MKFRVRRGDVWWVSLDDDKIRPSVVLTSDRYLPRLNRATIVPMTSTLRQVDTQVTLTPAEHGVPHISAANCHQLASVGEDAFQGFITHLNQDTMNAIVEALHLALDLEW